MSGGYMGKILRIDLTDCSLAEEGLSPENLRQSIGS